jgi:hypothetical protein
MDTEQRIQQLESKAIQVNLQPTEQENLKNNLFDGINGQNLKLTWKKRPYELLTVGVVDLTDSTTVTTDCNLGDIFQLTTTQNFTMANPTNGVNGKKIIYKIKQDSTGSRVITWDTKFRGSSSISLPILTTTASYVDYIGFIYDEAVDKWNCLAVVKGFAT